MAKKLFPIILVGLFILLIPFTAQSEGIPLQKDILLNAPIFGPEDLPDEITFTLYDSQTATTLLGSQTFERGQYTVDFEFSKSDGITSGNVARVAASFTEKLNINDDPESASKTKEIWLGFEVAGTEIGDRTKVSDGTLVQLLLASDASIATYLTLAYTGDDNPITTIYKDLPISSLSSDASGSSLSNYFSAVAAGASEGVIGPNALTNPNNWFPYLGDIHYKYGNVGIGTSSPIQLLHIKNGNSLIESTTGTASFRLKSGGVGARHWMFFSSGSDGAFGLYDIDASARRLTATTSGGIGIGTSSIGTYKLAVEGTIGCRELVVTTAPWADFVFEDNYRLPTLNEVDQFIQENKHLPGIPTEAEVKEKGFSVGNISSKLLQKIEELTLYVIDIKKENNSLKAQLANIEAQLKENKN